MALSFKARLYIGFIIAILLSAASGLASYLIFQKQAAQRVWVKRTRGVIDTARNIQTLMIDMETGRRGLRATNQKRFLEPYTAALQHIGPEIAGLKKLLSDNPEQESRAVILEQHIHAIMQFWATGNEDAEKYDRGINTQSTDEEKRQMDEIRAIITRLQKDENILLNKRREEYDALVRDTALSSGIDSILCEAIIIILVWFIFREFTKRTKVQEQLNSSIEKLRSQAIVLQTSEKKLQSAFNNVEEINKQLEKFVYTVAHDIKSPITGISGVLSLIEKNEIIAASPELSEYLSLSSSAAQYLCEKVNSLLEYSRISIDQQMVEEVNTKELLEQVSMLMFAPKNIHIQVAEIMPVFKTKKLKLEQVFQNLISNAIKYNDKQQGYIDIGYNNRNGYYEFYVKDNGQGIAEEDRHTIFELLNTGSSVAARETSTGFGLNIVKLTVEEQGGRIWVDSALGAGSTFFFEWKK